MGLFDFVGDILGIGGDAPAPPDPSATSAEQRKMNEALARLETVLNRFNQTTPYGASTWTQDPTNADKWSLSQTLSPEMQKILNNQIKTSLGLGGITDTSLKNATSALGVPLTTAGLPARTSLDTILGGSSNVNDYMQSIEDALYNKATSRLDPQFSRLEDQLRSSLAAQGITQGSEAYNREMDNFTRSRTDAYDTAQNSSIVGGTNAGNALFNMGIQGGNYANNLRGDQLSETTGIRNQILNELNALRSGQTVTNPEFSTQNTSSQIAPVNTTQNAWNAYNAQVGNYNANTQTNNDLLSGVASWAVSPSGLGTLGKIGTTIAGLF